MKKIMVGGLNKRETIKAIKKYDLKNFFTVIEGNDLLAAEGILSKKIDYYVGVCHSGAGGAFGALEPLIGREKCKTIAKAGSVPKEANIIKFVKEGAIAFGVVDNQIDNSMKILINLLSQ